MAIDPFDSDGDNDVRDALDGHRGSPSACTSLPWAARGSARRKTHDGAADQWKQSALVHRLGAEVSAGWPHAVRLRSAVCRYSNSSSGGALVRSFRH